MAKYFPLEMIDAMRTNETFDDYYEHQVNCGLIPADYTTEEYLQFVFSRDFFNPKYNGKYKDLNNFCLYNKRANRALLSGVRMDDLKMRRTEWRDYIGETPCLKEWTKYKLVYKIDNDFFHEIKYTQKLSCTFDALTHMPSNDMYFDLSDVKNIEPFMGAFVHIETVGKIVTVATYMVTDEYTIFSYYGEYNFEQLNELEADFNGLPKTDFVARNHSPNMDITELKTMNEEDHRTEVVIAIMQVMMFLSVDSGDINESPITKNTYKPSSVIKNKFSEIMMWDVGVRYGKAIKLAQKEALDYVAKENTKNINNASRKPIRPHVRRAHWQRYHVGVGRTEIRTNWIPPVYVCGNHEVSVTIRKVSK